MVRDSAPGAPAAVLLLVLIVLVVLGQPKQLEPVREGEEVHEQLGAR